ncbi:MAG TPA: efflux RND transporter permease subunit [Polyangiaceae bacterium]|nr:efflux RND transporter permease subunit [Polyangiaceae bacterium]
MAHISDQEMIKKTRNTARFFTENKHISWVLLVFTILWGVFSYMTLPKRKDPEIPVRVAAALLSWPGATAENVEERFTRVVERKLAENSKIERIESTTRSGVAVVTMLLDQSVKETGKEFDDIWLKLSSLNNLPEGASMEFMKDFGDTAALMMTVASPRASAVEVQLRARKIEQAIRDARVGALDSGSGARAALISCFPYTLDDRELSVVGKALGEWATAQGARDVRLLSGPGFLGIDSRTVAGDEKILTNARDFVRDRLRVSELHPDVWQPVVIRDPAETEAKLAAAAGEKYSYRDLDQYSETLEKALRRVPNVAGVSRAGVVGDVIYLDYSQEKLASYGVGPAQIKDALSTRNITARGGAVEVQGKTILIAPDGELRGEDEIGSIVITKSQSGAPVYLRDLVTISRAYDNARYASYASWKDRDGKWQRTRAVTLAVTMKSGQQIAEFGAAVDAKIAETKPLLPEDLVVNRVSDQPLQVAENLDLFMSSLYEAIVLVVLVALIGFWEWRSALLMALCIPITLAMTFGLMRLVGWDLQQISIGSLIIALGLLIDDPVVAGDAIKRDLARGVSAKIAAWLAPTRLANAILFATITNIVAYLPFATLTGDPGRFIISLPVVLTASLVASRLVSMTFVPLLGMALLRAPKKVEAPVHERRQHGFARLYAKLVQGAVKHRWASLAAAVALFFVAAFGVRGLKQNFFPKDVNYLAYVDVWLAEDAPVSATREKADEVEKLVRETAGDKLQSVTTFVGGGGPRFWFSISPEQRQSNYAQLIIRFSDKHHTSEVVGPLQDVLSARIAGARVDVQQIESGPAVGTPVAVRISGDDIGVLREQAEKLKQIMRKQPNAERVRDNWGSDNFTVKLDVDADRASAAGVTNQDVAASTGTALIGSRVGALQEGDHQLPISLRLRASERQRLSDVDNLYVYSSKDPSTKVPLRQISELDVAGATAKILRRNHVRTITVGAYPTPGSYPSEVLAQIQPELAQLQAELPPGYALEIGGEQAESTKSFKELAVVLIISVLSIFLALVFQFKSTTKPLVVFAAIPFGIVAALLSLRLMDAAFGMMAFLGIISLIGVIVSHVIVLFDYVEEEHERGAALEDALIDAGIMRMRPVLVTVGATVLGLVPLAMHGGPLWEPLCWVQIGGLTFATIVTLVIVPILYSIFVLDLKLIKWGPTHDDTAHDAPTDPGPAPSDPGAEPLPVPAE